MPKPLVKPSVLKKAIKRAVKPDRFTGIIIGASSTRPGYTQVQMTNGQVIEVYNPSVPNTAGYRVSIEMVEGVMTIKSYRQVYSDAISAVTPEHHTSHEYPNNDTVWVWKDQFLPLLVYPTSGFTVTIYGGVLYANATWGKLENQTLDLTASIPTGAARWVLIQTDSLGVITTVAGSTVASKTLLTVANLPAVTTGNLPLCAVKLYDGQTQLTRDTRVGKINDFLDLRFAGFSLDSDTVDLAALIHAATSATIADDDEIAFWQNTSSGLRKWTWGELKTLLQVELPVEGVHDHGLTRWNSAGGTTFDYPDLVDVISNVGINGLTENPLYYTLSADGSQLVFDTAVTTGFEITSEYELRLL